MCNKEFKKTIELARKLKGLSQRQLAKKIGLSQSTYNDIINGKIEKVNIENIKKIADGLELSFESLIKQTYYKIIFDYIEEDYGTVL